MGALEEWLAQRGPAIAQALDAEREPICAAVSSHLAMAFPTLCYDSTRPDALAFQQRTFRETPRRFHRVLQVVLLLQTLEVITHEYRWGWPVIARYGVERHQVIMQVRWYFEAARTYAALQPTDAAPMSELAATILQIINQITADPTATPAGDPIRRNGFHP